MCEYGDCGDYVVCGEYDECGECDEFGECVGCVECADYVECVYHSFTVDSWQRSCYIAVCPLPYHRVSGAGQQKLRTHALEECTNQ